METEKFSAKKKWQQTQFNEKMGKYGKSKLEFKKYVLIWINIFGKKINVYFYDEHVFFLIDQRN
jgi:hypothetical protein